MPRSGRAAGGCGVAARLRRRHEPDLPQLLRYRCVAAVVRRRPGRRAGPVRVERDAGDRARRHRGHVMSRAAVVVLALGWACKGGGDDTETQTTASTVIDTTPPVFPLPDDLA